MINARAALGGARSLGATPLESLKVEVVEATILLIRLIKETETIQALAAVHQIQTDSRALARRHRVNLFLGATCSGSIKHGEVLEDRSRTLVKIAAEAVH